RNGKHESNAPSRFLREIAPQYLQNPLRKEDFMTERVMDDDDHPGFRFGGFGAKREVSPRAPLGRNDRGGTVRNDRPFKSQPTTLDAVRNRPLPPKVPDAEFTPDPMSSFRVGDRVEHNRFGVGKVLDISGEVPDIKAKVAFENYGEKILLLKYAKIRHLPL
ncbi:MAG: hypothetical protein IKD95_01785, partial [Bacteroidales bacterium]|nr:hypothetical protein [Bacteroidales bacterium]